MTPWFSANAAGCKWVMFTEMGTLELDDEGDDVVLSFLKC